MFSEQVESHHPHIDILSESIFDTALQIIIKVHFITLWNSVQSQANITGY